MDRNEKEQLRRFYEEEAPEELRLHPSSVQHLEYRTATRYLDRYLPQPAAVLDNCAGTGIYAFYLAGRGHRVTAGDLVARNVEVMQRQNAAGEHALENIYEGDALAMPQFADGSFDAVLCMGALYHLHTEEQRLLALREALRVLRPGGLLFASYMNRYGVILNNLQPDLGNRDDMLRFAATGEEGVFYASTAGDTAALMEKAGAGPVCHLALDGPAYFLAHTAGLLDAEGLARWPEVHFALCEEPSLLGASYHNLYIGRKPGDA